MRTHQDVLRFHDFAEKPLKFQLHVSKSSGKLVEYRLRFAICFGSILGGHLSFSLFLILSLANWTDGLLRFTNLVELPPLQICKIENMNINIDAKFLNILGLLQFSAFFTLIDTKILPSRDNYGVVHQVVQFLLLTSKHKFRHSIETLYKSAILILMSTKRSVQPDGPPFTESRSHWRAKLRDWAVRPVRAGCYSLAALFLFDSKTLYGRSDKQRTSLFRVPLWGGGCRCGRRRFRASPTAASVWRGRRRRSHLALLARPPRRRSLWRWLVLQLFHKQNGNHRWRGK